MIADRVPLKYLARLNPETLTDSTDPAFSFGYVDIGSTGRGQLRETPEWMSFGDSPSRARRVLREGDSILSTVRTYLRGAWTVPSGMDQLVASTGFVCLRPRTGVDARYLGWLVQSDVVIDEVVARSVGVSYPAISPEEVGRIEAPRPAEPRQKEIADYLDRETARIDALIAAKQQMVELLEERWQGVLESTIRELVRRFGDQRLKYACREIVVGIVVTPSAWYADAGIPAIRGTNVSPGTISLDELVFLTREGHLLHRNSQLQTGDVVVVRTGKAGAAAVVPPELNGANCIDLVIIRPSESYSPWFLEYVLNSDWMQKHIDEHSVGTIQSHFNVGAASAVPVPWAPRSEQDAAVQKLDAARRTMRELAAVLSLQVELLRERRRGLVNEAVNAGRIPIEEAV